MDHGTNITCQHRDANGDHYPSCQLPECIDGVLACEVHLIKDQKPAVTYDKDFGGRLCRDCAGGAVAASKCAVCPTDHGVDEVALVNKSTIRLCRRCQRIHQAMVAAVDADDLVIAAEARGAA